MGCGCNKVKVYSPTNPLVLGDPDGQPAVNVRSTIAVLGLRANSEFWAAGTGVATMIDAGWLQAI
jgi:hypothetical protein